MKDIAIVYASYHHKNTEKVAKYLQTKIDCDLFDVLTNPNISLENYKTIILASGIYFSKFHKQMREFIDKTNFENKSIILLYTCGVKFWNYANRVKKVLIKKKANILGICSCKGYDTYVFRSFGGIAKNRPNEKDLTEVETKVK